MTGGSANFVGDIPEVYDRDLGPYIFEYFADDLAKRAAALEPLRVLEIAAGIGIVTRKLRDALKSGAKLQSDDRRNPGARHGRPGSHYWSAD